MGLNPKKHFEKRSPSLVAAFFLSASTGIPTTKSNGFADMPAPIFAPTTAQNRSHPTYLSQLGRIAEKPLNRVGIYPNY